MTAVGRRRLAAVALAAATVPAGLTMRFVLPRGVATDIGGDALYAVLVYAAVVLIAPRARPALVAGVAGSFCVAIELFQLTGLPRLWGADFPPIALVLGTGFDARDIVVYVAAAALAAGVDMVTGRTERCGRRRSRWPADGPQRRRRPSRRC